MTTRSFRPHLPEALARRFIQILLAVLPLLGEPDKSERDRQDELAKQLTKQAVLLIGDLVHDRRKNRRRWRSDRSLKS